MNRFSPSSAERRGMLLLSMALLLLVAVGVVVHRNNQRSADPSLAPASAYYAVPERTLQTFPFDPNTADSTALLALGFAPYQVRGIYKYRAMGGRYHEPEDVKRIPGMTNEMWERLAPYVTIDRRYQYVTPPAPRPSRARQDVYAQQTEHRDTVRYPLKLTEGHAIPLNRADTNQLKRVPGIGSYYARQIVLYRERLGGYVSADQLQEIAGMPEDVARWFTLEPDDTVRRLDVNHATKSQLVRHPYLRGYRAQSIWDYRHNYGRLRSIDDLRALPDFSEADVRRLAPYLCFD